MTQGSFGVHAGNSRLPHGAGSIYAGLSQIEEQFLIRRAHLLCTCREVTHEDEEYRHSHTFECWLDPWHNERGARGGSDA